MKRCDLMPMKVDPDVQFADGMVRDLGGTVPCRVVSSTAQNRNNHLQLMIEQHHSIDSSFYKKKTYRSIFK